MKLGICLPQWMPHRTDVGNMVEWARLADDAGFFLLGAIDRPNGDTWDPLISLAGVAPVTKRIMLGPMILQLPNRDEVNVAKQAASIDRLSNGRFILGVGAGGRRDDFAVHDARYADRWNRFPSQIARIREVWEQASAADPEDPILGPAPVQRPAPIWVAAVLEKTMKRAVELADGITLSQGSDGIPGTRDLVSWIREEAVAAGKPDFHISRVIFVAAGPKPDQIRDEALGNMDRFYNAYTWTPLENMLTIGEPEEIAETVAVLAEAGLDSLLLIPALHDPQQVEILATKVLPPYLH